MKFLKYILILGISFSVGSCTDYLDKSPDDQLTLDMVFGDKQRTEEWLAGIYNAIPDPYLGFTRNIGYDAMSDDLAPSPGWTAFGWNVIQKQNGNWSPSSTQEGNVDFYTDLPKRIHSAYIFIANARPNISQNVTQDDVDRMKNEARFLIAYYNWLLLEAYGPFPFHDGLTASDASEADLMIGQVPYDNIVSWIDSQLKDLSIKLPTNYDGEPAKYGRATSIMCLAVRARMLLFAASPLVNGNPDYKDFKNNKGELLFNPAYDSNKWVKAADACKELIDAAQAAGHDLYREYNEDGSIDPFLSYQNMMLTKQSKTNVRANPEILFARPSNTSRDYDHHAQPRGTGGFGGLGVTQSLVDAFYMSNGLPIDDPNSGYSETGFSAAPDKRNTKWIEGDKDADKITGALRPVTAAGTYNMYYNREPRFYISVLYNRAWFRRSKRTTRFMANEADGGPTYDAPQSGYLVRKKVSPSYDPTTGGAEQYRPGILYRLGEAYLNYAEALNETDPTNSDILTYVNLIRGRAGIPDLDPSLLGDQNKMREAIRHERRVELNCEDGIRWDDIRRWKIGETVLNGPFYGMNFTGTVLIDDPTNTNAKAYFKRAVYQNRVFEKKMYWFPIPQKQIDINPNLVQNPFWK